MFCGWAIMIDMWCKLCGGSFIFDFFLLNSYEYQFGFKENLPTELAVNLIYEDYINSVENFIDHNYITSENTSFLVEGINQRCSLIVMHLNIRSLALNYDKLKILVTSMKNQPHVICLNETWIKGGQQGEFNAFLDYVLVSNCRSKYRGRGEAFYIKKNFSFTIKNSYSKMIEKFFESLFIDISLNNDKLTIGTVYRSPNQELTANLQFIDHRTPILKAISKSQTPIIITGDQNYNLVKYNKNCASDLIDLLYENSFYPAITKLTRFTATSATVLDHMWTNILNKKLASAVMVDCEAVHLPILLCVQLHNPPTQIRNQIKQ